MQKWVLHHSSLSVNRNYIKNQISTHRFINCCHEFLDIDQLGISRFSAYFQRNTRFCETRFSVFSIFLKSICLSVTHFPKYLFAFTPLEKNTHRQSFFKSNEQNYSFFEEREKNGLTSKKKPMFQGVPMMDSPSQFFEFFIFSDRITKK